MNIQNVMARLSLVAGFVTLTTAASAAVCANSSLPAQSVPGPNTTVSRPVQCANPVITGRSSATRSSTGALSVRAELLTFPAATTTSAVRAFGFSNIGGAICIALATVPSRNVSKACRPEVVTYGGRIEF